MLAAMCAARNSLGFEIDSAMQPVLLEKMAAAFDTSSLLVRERLQAHTIFVHERQKSKGVLKYFNSHHGFPVMTQQEEDLCLKKIKNFHYASNNRFKVAYSNPAENREPGPERPTEPPARRTRGRQLKIF